MIKAIILALIGSVATAYASPQDDLAANVENSNHDKHTAWIVERMMTFHIGDKCFAKVVDRNAGAFGKIASTARYIQRYALAVTGDDWGHIESQSTNTRDENRKIVDKMVSEFAPKFHITIKREGDDCEPIANAMWVKYMVNAVLALDKYPPKSGKMTVVIDANTKTKGMTAVVGKDGSTLTITGSRDIEPVGWSDTIENALKRVSSKG